MLNPKKRLKASKSHSEARLIGEFLSLAFLYTFLKTKKFPSRIIRRAISALVALLFIFNCTVPDIAPGLPQHSQGSDTLAVPLKCDDLAGIEHKDMGRIQLALEAQLMTIDLKGLQLEAGVFLKMQEQASPERSVFNPSFVQFCFRSCEPRGNGVLVKCKVMEGNEVMPRVYYAFFSKARDEDGGFRIEVYTDREYKRFGRLIGIAKPERKAEDAGAIARYVQHEKGVDEIIRFAHENGLAKEPIAGRFSYADEVNRILGRLAIDVRNPAGLVPIQQRRFYLINLTDDIEKMKAKLPKAKVMISGREHEVSYLAHSSNNAVHVFVGSAVFDRLTRQDAAVSGDMLADARIVVLNRLVHEIGVMLGLPALELSGERGLVNELDNRHRSASPGMSAGGHSFEALALDIADLDTSLKRRDYAADDEGVVDVIIGSNCRIERDRYRLSRSEFEDGSQVLRVPAGSSINGVVVRGGASHLSKFADLRGGVIKFDSDRAASPVTIDGLTVPSSHTLMDRQSLERTAGKFGVSAGSIPVKTVQAGNETLVLVHASYCHPDQLLLPQGTFTDTSLWRDVGRFMGHKVFQDGVLYLDEAELEQEIGKDPEYSKRGYLVLPESDCVEVIIKLREGGYLVRRPADALPKNGKPKMEKPARLPLPQPPPLPESPQLPLPGFSGQPAPAGNSITPQNVMTIIFNFMGPNEMFSAPQLLQIYGENYRKLGFAAPAPDRELMLKRLRSALEDIASSNGDALISREGFGGRGKREWRLTDSGRKAREAHLNRNGLPAKPASPDMEARSEREEFLDSLEGIWRSAGRELNHPLSAKAQDHFGLIVDLANRYDYKRFMLEPDHLYMMMAAYLFRGEPRRVIEFFDWARTEPSAEYHDHLLGFEGLLAIYFTARLMDTQGIMSSKARNEEYIKYCLGRLLRTPNIPPRISSALRNSADMTFFAVRDFIQLYREQGKYGDALRLVDNLLMFHTGMDLEGLAPGSNDRILDLRLRVMQKNSDQAPPPGVARALAEQKEVEAEIAAMKETAARAGLMIPTHAEKRYTLLMTEEFFDAGELEAHKRDYGDYFNIQMVSGMSPEKFIQNVLDKAAQVRKGTAIALVPDSISDSQLSVLAKNGVRFIRTKTDILRSAKMEKDIYRKKFQLDTYVMMLLARRIDDQIPEDSAIYRLLAFYLRSHFALESGVAVKDYIEAIAKDDVTRLIRGYLSYRPIQKYDASKEYESIAKVLISA